MKSFFLILKMACCLIAIAILAKRLGPLNKTEEICSLQTIINTDLNHARAFIIDQVSTAKQTNVPVPVMGASEKVLEKEKTSSIFRIQPLILFRH